MSSNSDKKILKSKKKSKNKNRYRKKSALPFLSINRNLDKRIFSESDLDELIQSGWINVTSMDVYHLIQQGFSSADLCEKFKISSFQLIQRINS